MKKVITIERLKLSVMLRRKLVVCGVNSINKLLDIKNNHIELSDEEFKQIENLVNEAGLKLYAENRFVENLDLNTKLKNTIKKLGIKSFDELFSITKEDLLNLDEVGELSAGKILTAIDSYKKLKTI